MKKALFLCDPGTVENAIPITKRIVAEIQGALGIDELHENYCEQGRVSYSPTDTLREFFQKASANDILLLFVMCHGGTADELLVSDEADGKDETFKFGEWLFTDDEIRRYIGLAPTGCSIFYYSAACFNGSPADLPVHYTYDKTNHVMKRNTAADSDETLKLPLFNNVISLSDTVDLKENYFVKTPYSDLSGYCFPLMAYLYQNRAQLEQNHFAEYSLRDFFMEYGKHMAKRDQAITIGVTNDTLIDAKPMILFATRNDSIEGAEAPNQDLVPKPLVPVIETLKRKWWCAC